MIMLLCSVSSYFTYQVQARRQGLKGKRNAAKLASGTKVEPIKAIDGDEASVKAAGTPAIVRILGIKAFSATANEGDFQTLGRSARNELNKLMRGGKGPLVVEYAVYKRDRHGRTLAYLRRGEKDVGLELVRKGLVMVYTRYPFARQSLYLTAEARARAQDRGLWGSKQATERAKGLKAAWAEASQEAGK